MYENLFLIILALIWLVIASIQDLRKREVENWISFSLIIFALAYRAFYSFFSSNYLFFLYGLAGFAIFFILANVFYYARVFAGGDVKLLMGLGAVLPFSNSIFINLILFLGFLFLLMLIGGIYGLVYSLILVSSNTKKFYKQFFKNVKKNKKLIYFSLILIFLSLIITLYSNQIILMLLVFMLLIFPILFIFAKTVEEKYMIKEISSKKVTVGDWLYQEVSIGRKKIKPCWEGLNEKEVALLRRHGGRIKIKQGIPFVPVFLIAFILLVYLWYSSWSFFKLFWF